MVDYMSFTYFQQYPEETLNFYYHFNQKCPTQMHILKVKFQGSGIISEGEKLWGSEPWLIESCH